MTSIQSSSLNIHIASKINQISFKLISISWPEQNTILELFDSSLNSEIEWDYNIAIMIYTCPKTNPTIDLI